MKKFILITLVLVIATAFAFAAFQAADVAGDGFAVGWNSRRAMFNSSAGTAESVSFRIKPPIYTPNVGWNS